LKLLLEDRLKAIQDNPMERLSRIGLQPGMRVVDLGAGRGLYSLLSSSMVGKAGTVFAVEPDISRAETIGKRIKQEKLENINVLTTGAENLAEIPSSTIDIAFALNSMHHFNNKQAAFAEVNRVLKTGGKFYVRDMIKSWLTWHGTRREEIPNLPLTGYTGKTLAVTRSRLEATFTK
jgi:ubiquinone/menaquinone biosynthesis C-methylase UbiE